jgi:outer membrane lipoprotein-sorting protein
MNQSSNDGHVDAIDELVASLRDDMPSPDVESRLQQRMRQHWRSIDEQQQPVGWWSQWLPNTPGRLVAACGVAAAVLFVAPLVLHMLFSSQSVYAQVLAGVRRAHTIHAEGVRIKDGEKTDTAEIWYDAERGVREDFGKEGVRIDDGQFEWVYRAAANTVVKGPSRDPVGDIEEMLRPVKAIDRLSGKRTQELDAAFDGAECRAFVAMPIRAAAMRLVLWLDDRNRLIRFEEQLNVDGVWTLDERIDMQYDVPIPDERFAANFPPETRLIDRTAVLEGFDLEDASATAERLGIVLAIHEVRRVGDDTVFVMSTSRASQEVIDRFGKIDSRHDGDKVYGQFTWSSNGRRLPDHRWRAGMRVVPLASWRKDGVDYQWVVLRNTSSWIQDDGRLPVGFRVYTRSEWQKALKSAGKPWHRNERDVLSLNVPADSEELEAVLAHVYAQTLSMGDATVRGAPRLHLKSVPFAAKDIEEAVAAGTPREEAERLLHGRSSQPENITLPAWQAEVLAVMAEQDGRMKGNNGE